MNCKKWMMAALLSASTLATVKAQTSSPVKDDLFTGTEIFAKNATDVNEISMDPAMLGMVAGKDGHKAHGMVLNVVRSYSYDKPGMYNIADVEMFRNKLNTGDWHCSVHTRDTKHGESTDICNKARTDGMKETAIITVEPKELTFIHTITHAGSHEGGDSLMMLPGMEDLPTLAMLDNLEMPALSSLPAINMNMKGLADSIQMRLKDIDPLDSEQINQIIHNAQRSVDEAQKSLHDAPREASEPDHQKQPKQPE